MGLVVLHALLLPPSDSLTADLILFFRHTDASTALPSHSPLWLRHSLSSEHPYAYLTETAVEVLKFLYDVPSKKPEAPSDSSYLYELFCAAKFIQSDEPGIETSATFSHTSASQSVNSCFSWLKGILAYKQKKYTLATNEFKFALETYSDLLCVLYSAFLVYRKTGRSNAAVKCLQLLLKVSLTNL